MGALPVPEIEAVRRVGEILGLVREAGVWNESSRVADLFEGAVKVTTVAAMACQAA